MSNGIKFDAAGNMIVAEGADYGGRRVTRTDMKTGKAAEGFGTNGQIDPASLASLSPTISWDPAVTAAGTSTVKLDFSGLTGYGSDYQVTKINQNGSGLGRMSGVEVDAKGVLNLLYTNGSKLPAYQLAQRAEAAADDAHQRSRLP